MEWITESIKIANDYTIVHNTVIIAITCVKI